MVLSSGMTGMKASSMTRSEVIAGKVMAADLLWRDTAFPESFGTVPASVPAIRTMTMDSARAKLDNPFILSDSY